MLIRRTHVTFAGGLLLSICLQACSTDEPAIIDCLPQPEPPCGQPYQSPCGCVGGPVTNTCLPDDLLVRGDGSCALCRPGACIDASSSYPLARCAATCSDIKLAYANARTRAQVGGAVSGRASLEPGPYNGSSSCEPADCVVTPDHCEVGLDLCWHIGPPIEELERLAEFYVELGCPADLSCNCAAPPANVTCEVSQEGFEIWGSAGKFSHACVIH